MSFRESFRELLLFFRGIEGSEVELKERLKERSKIFTRKVERVFEREIERDFDI